MEEEENKWENKPTEEKVQNKLTKARQAGYDEFKSQLIKNKINFDNFLASFGEKNFFNDPIELCRDKAADLFLVFMDRASQDVILRSETIAMPGLIGNCLNGKSRQKSFNIMLKFIELDKKYLAVEALAKGTLHKNPKIGQACLELLKTAVSKIDVDCDKVLTFMKPNMELIESREKIIRDELKFLLVELTKKSDSKLLSKIRSYLQAYLTDNKKIEAILQEIEKLATPIKPIEVTNVILTSLPVPPTLITLSQASQPQVVHAPVETQPVTPLLPLPQSSPQPEPQIETPQININSETETQSIKNTIITDKTETREEIKKENNQPSTVSIFKSSNEVSPQSKTNNNNNKKVNIDFKEIDNAVLKCIINDGKFLSAGTIELLKTIVPAYEPPSKKVINKQLEQKKHEYEQDLVKQFENITDIALSAELIKNSRNSYYLCLRGHYFDKKFQYKSIVISFKRFIQSEHLSIKINSFIKYELNRLQITNKVRTITTNNTEYMNKTSENNDFGTRVSCLVDNLNLTIIETLNNGLKSSSEFDKDFHDESHYCDSTIDDYESDQEEETIIENKKNSFEEYNSAYDTDEEISDSDDHKKPIKINQKSISRLINKIRKTIRLITNSKELSDYIRKEAKKENIKQKLAIDMYLRWHSTYIMIENYLKHTKILDDILTTRPVSIGINKLESLKALKCDIREIIVLKSINEVLQLFHEQSLILQSKAFLPLSFSQVIISTLKKYLLDKSFIHNNSQCVNEIKELFYEKFSIYFDSGNKSKERCLRLISAYLNPTHFRFLSQLEKNEVEKSLETLELSFVNAAKYVINNSKNKNHSPDLVNDMFSRLRSKSPSTSNGINKLTVKEELVYYVVRIKQNNLLSNDESMHKTTSEKFWLQEKDSLVHLYSLFSQVSGTPCTATDGQKSFSVTSYIERKDKLSLYSKKLTCSKVFEEI